MIQKTFVNDLALDIYGMKLSAAHDKNICVSCKASISVGDLTNPIPTCKPGNIYSESGLREYRISGLCETCFDEVLP